MIIRKLKLMMLLLSPSIALLLFALSFFLGQDFVDVVGVEFVLSSSFIVLILCLFENLIEFESLLIEEGVNILLQLLLRLLL